MEQNYILLTEKEQMWAQMLMQVLKDHNIPFVSEGVNGAGFSLKTGIQDRIRVYVPKEMKERSAQLLNTLFSGEAV